MKTSTCLGCGHEAFAWSLTDGYCGMGCRSAYEAGRRDAMEEHGVTRLLRITEAAVVLILAEDERDAAAADKSHDRGAVERWAKAEGVLEMARKAFRGAVKR